VSIEPFTGTQIAKFYPMGQCQQMQQVMQKAATEMGNLMANISLRNWNSVDTQTWNNYCMAKLIFEKKEKTWIVRERQSKLLFEKIGIV